VEKAILLADFILKKDDNATLSIDIDGSKVQLKYKGDTYKFVSLKSLKKSVKISGYTYEILQVNS